jgi:hypothetical protein
MTILNTGGGGASAPLSAGRVLTRQSVIEVVHKRTKRIGESLDMNLEFLVALQEFCASNRWYWRRRSLPFNSAQGEPVYDFADIGAGDLERFIRLYIVESDETLTKIDPEFDHDQIDRMLSSSKTGKPSKYFADGDGLHLYPIPDAAYDLRLPYWAIPTTLPEKQANNIPMVPGPLHYIVAAALEKNVYRIILGDKAKEYLASKEYYEAQVARASNLTDFVDGNIRQWIDQEDGIQSL